MRRALMLLTAGLVAAGAFAGEPVEQPVDRGRVILSWDEFVKITGYDPAKKGAQVLTIPWAEVEGLLGVKVEQVGKAATVDLPWQEFKALLQWSIQRKAGEPTGPPPTDFVVVTSEYSGTLGDEAADLTLKLALQVLRDKGWKRIPVLPGSVALTKVTLPEGVFLNSTGNSYELLTEKTGAVAVEIGFSSAVRKEKGINQVTIDRVTPGSSVLDLAIAREGVDVKVAGAQSLVSKSAAGKTQVAAAIPTGAALAISWERALPKVEAAPTKLYAETRTLVAVAEGVLLCQEAVNYNILHTGVRELRLQVPKETSVLTVVGQNVQDWQVDPQSVLLVVLRGEVLGTQTLTVTYERTLTESVEAPVIRAIGTERERGYVGVVALSNVEIASGEVTGARQIDVRMLPAELVAMTSQPVLLAYRYIGEAFSIPIIVKKHAEVEVLVTIVDSVLFTAMQLDDGRRITKAVYNVRNNRNQFLRLKMPAGMAAGAAKAKEPEIWSVEVGGKTVAPAKDDQGNVLVPLVRSAAGTQELSSFPVEIVYVEAPEAAAPSYGTLKVTLPLVVDAPVMHAMVSYWLPAEGSYKSFWGVNRFAGTLRLVDKDFTQLQAGPGRQIVAVNAEAQAAQMQQQVEVREDVRARAAGAEPIRVKLPINGKQFKLERILVLPGDPLWFSVKYSGWEAPE